jgi:hypothetical protein
MMRITALRAVLLAAPAAMLLSACGAPAQLEEDFCLRMRLDPGSSQCSCAVDAVKQTLGNRAQKYLEDSVGVPGAGATTAPAADPVSAAEHRELAGKIDACLPPRS